MPLAVRLPAISTHARRKSEGETGTGKANFQKRTASVYIIHFLYFPNESKQEIVGL